METNGATCIACGVLFQSCDEQRVHYRSPFHRFNLKRKVALLPPVNQATFERRIAEIEKSNQPKAAASFYCPITKKKFSSQNAYDQHKKSKKFIEAQAKHELKQQTDVTDVNHEDSPMTDEEPSTTTTTTTATTTTNDNDNNNTETNTTEKKDDNNDTTTTTTTTNDNNNDNNNNDEDVSLEQHIQRKIENSVHLSINECLFSGKMSPNFTRNLEHMQKYYGFFIPDADYINDPEGLVKYLGEKVSVGNFCIECNKNYSSLEAVRHHMVATNHCHVPDFDDVKVVPDDEVEIYDSFYDYSKLLSEKEELERKKPKWSDDGFELILYDGRVIGNREFARYYKQSFRRRETRQSVLANQIAAQQRALGWKQTVSREIVLARNDGRKFQNTAKKWKMQTGVKANALQTHFRHQNPK